MKRNEPFPNPLGWRVSARIRGGLAHYFYGHISSHQQRMCSVCSAAAWQEVRDLYPERMARRRCKTCDRSAKKRGMQ